MMIDIDKFICSLCENGYGTIGMGDIKYALKEQGFIYKDGELQIIEPDTPLVKADNWYTCDIEVVNSNGVIAFHPGELYYCPKDGWIDVCGALFKVGTLDVFRPATEEEINREVGNSDIPQRMVSAKAKEEAVRIAREEVIEKACEWLNNFYSEDRHCFLVKEDIEAFKQAMEKG